MGTITTSWREGRVFQFESAKLFLEILVQFRLSARIYLNGMEDFAGWANPDTNTTYVSSNGCRLECGALALKRLGLLEISGILTYPLLPSYHLFNNMHENRMNIADFYGFAYFNSFNPSA